MHVHNDCDIAGICPNGRRFAARVRALGGSVEDVIIDSSGLRVPSCDDSCGTDEMADGQIGTVESFRGLARHMRWPTQWNQLMLNFLRRHPLGIANDQAKREPGATLSLRQNSSLRLWLVNRRPECALWRGHLGGANQGRRHQDCEGGVKRGEYPRWCVVEDQAVRPVTDEVTRVARLSCSRTQPVLERGQRTHHTENRFEANQCNRHKVREAKQNPLTHSHSSTTPIRICGQAENDKHDISRMDNYNRRRRARAISTMISSSHRRSVGEGWTDRSASSMRAEAYLQSGAWLDHGHAGAISSIQLALTVIGQRSFAFRRRHRVVGFSFAGPARPRCTSQECPARSRRGP